MREILSKPRSAHQLRVILDGFMQEADFDALARGDPIELMRGYPRPDDQEVAALIVCAMAYGRVASIKDRATALLERLGPAPAEAIASARTRRRLDGFVYRFQKGDDYPRFLQAISQLRDRRGSLAAAFARHVRDEDTDYAPAMDRFVLELRAAVRGELTRGLAFLMPRVKEDSGAGKRMCLYLRWMTRDQGVDLGTWSKLVSDPLDPSRLVIPLDTHIERIGRYIGLTDRRTPGLRTARDITAGLSKLRPEDPLYYDIALCHLGIGGTCPRRRDVEKCRDCPIRGACRLGRTPRGWRS